MNPYETLGISQSATSEEIETAWHSFAKQHHPDKGGNPEVFKRGSTAVAVLRDPVKRKQYDETGHISEDVDIDKAALQMIQSGVNALLRQSEVDFDTMDILEALRQMIDQKLEDVGGQLKQHEDAVKRISSAIKRTKIKNKKKHRLNPMFEWFRREVSGVIGKIKRDIAIAERAREMLNDYTYEHDAPKPSAGNWLKGYALNNIYGEK